MDITADISNVHKPKPRKDRRIVESCRKLIIGHQSREFGLPAYAVDKERKVWCDLAPSKKRQF